MNQVHIGHGSMLPQLSAAVWNVRCDLAPDKTCVQCVGSDCEVATDRRRVAHCSPAVLGCALRASNPRGHPEDKMVSVIARVSGLCSTAGTVLKSYLRNPGPVFTIRRDSVHGDPGSGCEA
jgi:hypothetical protein